MSKEITYLIDVECKSLLWKEQGDLTHFIHSLATEVLKTAVPFIPHVELNIVLTDDEEIAQLNQAYRQKPYPTNVLSFPLHSPPLKSCSFWQENLPCLLGDVILSYETIMRESVLQKKIFHSHFCHLLIHGMLHLLGYDHETEEEAEEMEALEIDLLHKRGVANPYVSGRGLC